ncbi:retrotransposon protein, putative, ty1-copia subclass [Tanacetum coccineum]
MDTAYGRRWICRIGNYEYVFTCEDLALICRISFPGYGVLVRMGPPAKGVGLRLADSHTGNHPEDDFTPLETIRRSYCVIRKRILFELEGETFEPEKGVFRAFFEKQRLIGPNFIDWYRNLRIELSVEDKLPFLEQPIHVMPVPPAGQVLPFDVLNTHTAWVKASKEIVGRAVTSSDRKRASHVQIGRKTVCKLLRSKMKSYIDNLECLDHAMTQNLVLSLILVSLRKEYDIFVQNYNIHGMGKTMTKLHAMLKLHEQTLPKKEVAPALHAIRAGKVQKKNKNKKPRLVAKGNNQGKGKSKLAYAPKPKIPPPPKKDNPSKDSICHQCGDVVLETFKVFQKEVENQLEETIKSLRSDRGGKYEFLDHLKEHGIIAHRTPPYTPQHNGVSERINRTLLDMARSMISQTTLPKSFWDYDLESAAHILNMVPTKKGCEALVKRDTLTKPDELKPKSIKCIFIGYPKEIMGYSFYYPPKNKIFVARNVEFLKNSLMTQEASGSLEYLEIIQEEDTHPSANTNLDHDEDDQEIDEHQSDINPIRRSIRTRRAPHLMCLYIDAEEHELGDYNEPANYKSVLLDPEFEKWLDVMNVEMQSMKDNEVWDLVDLPPDGKTVGSKWLFKKKTDMDGAIHTYKACLIVKGFTQTYRVDYEETFSTVADIRAIRILVAITAFDDYEI